jgi:hypothetical protein
MRRTKPCRISVAQKSHHAVRPLGLTSGHDVPKLFEETGLKFRIITGYPEALSRTYVGTSEVQCRAITIAAFFGRSVQHWHKNGFVRVMIQTRANAILRFLTPALFELMDQYKTPETKRLSARIAPAVLVRPIVSTPSLPADRAQSFARRMPDAQRPGLYGRSQKKRLGA